nr:antibiotic biosynthesis monooxygenase [Sphingomonas sp. BGYR3]
MREGAEPKLRALLNTILPVTLKYDGCLGISPHYKQDGSNKFMMIEWWQSLEHYKRYVAWRDSTGDLNSLMDLLEGPPSVDLWPLELVD